MPFDLVPVEPQQRRCALYRHYDAIGVLLYVGISETLMDRTADHARSSEWARFAHRATAEWFDTRGLAEHEERQAIRNETPIFNRQHAVGDADQRIANYLRERELDELRGTVALYEHAVAAFIRSVPQHVAMRAQEDALHDYRCAGLVVDASFAANVLRHLGRRVDQYMDELVQANTASTYEKARNLVDECLDSAAERHRHLQARVQAGDETYLRFKATQDQTEARA